MYRYVCVGERLERQVRVPDGVDDERLRQPASPLRHDEGRQQPRLEGLRHRHATRLRSAVRYYLLYTKGPCTNRVYTRSVD